MSDDMGQEGDLFSLCFDTKLCCTRKADFCDKAKNDPRKKSTHSSKKMTGDEMTECWKRGKDPLEIKMYNDIIISGSVIWNGNAIAFWHFQVRDSVNTPIQSHTRRRCVWIKFQFYLISLSASAIFGRKPNQSTRKKKNWRKKKKKNSKIKFAKVKNLSSQQSFFCCCWCWCCHLLNSKSGICFIMRTCHCRHGSMSIHINGIILAKSHHHHLCRCRHRCCCCQHQQQRPGLGCLIKSNM